MNLTHIEAIDVLYIQWKLYQGAHAAVTFSVPLVMEYTIDTIFHS